VEPHIELVFGRQFELITRHKHITVTVPFTLERHFRDRYPQLRLDLTHSLTHEGDVLCAAAVSASYQLCWRIIERFTSAAVARRLFHDLFFDAGVESSAVNPVDAAHADLLVERAQTWLAHHMATKVSMAELAQYAAVSERTLLRRFQRALKMTPHEYLRDLRLNTAKRGLELTRLQVDKIAHGVGYADTAFFAQIFKRHTGLSPSAFRRRMAAHRSRSGTSAG
jgi:transcriptional regulator GlxA family with amidase domain